MKKKHHLLCKYEFKFKKKKKKGVIQCYRHIYQTNENCIFRISHNPVYNKIISYPAKYASSFTNHLIHSEAFRSFSWDEMSEGHAMSIQRPVLTNLTPAADGGG